MTRVVLVHGAFRGGWAWDRVVPLLNTDVADVSAPTLTGCEAGSPLIGTRVRLSTWADDVARAAGGAIGSEPVLLVGHSQGGIVISAVADLLAGTPVTLLYLDAPSPRDGERGVDLNPPGTPSPPPDLSPDLWVPARPVGPDEGFADESLRDFVNERLTPTPLGPSLDPVERRTPSDAVRQVYAFCSLTPTAYPCWTTRQRLDESGQAYELLEGHHDAPLLQPAQVAELINRAMA